MGGWGLPGVESETQGLWVVGGGGGFSRGHLRKRDALGIANTKSGKRI